MTPTTLCGAPVGMPNRSPSAVLWVLPSWVPRMCLWISRTRTCSLRRPLTLAQCRSSFLNLVRNSYRALRSGNAKWPFSLSHNRLQTGGWARQQNGNRPASGLCHQLTLIALQWMSFLWLLKWPELTCVSRSAQSGQLHCRSPFCRHLIRSFL